MIPGWREGRGVDGEEGRGGVRGTRGCCGARSTLNGPESRPLCLQLVRLPKVLHLFNLKADGMHKAWAALGG